MYENPQNQSPKTFLCLKERCKRLKVLKKLLSKSCPCLAIKNGRMGELGVNKFLTPCFSQESHALLKEDIFSKEAKDAKDLTD